MGVGGSLDLQVMDEHAVRSLLDVEPEPDLTYLPWGLRFGAWHFLCAKHFR